MSLDPKKPIFICGNCEWYGDDPIALTPGNFSCPNCQRPFRGRPKLLFVDDRTKRIHYALENFSDKFDVTIATCVPEALRQMSAQDWDVISLDHDLNGHDFQDPDTPTCGMEIVRYIRKCGGWPEKHFGTHYNNPIRHKPEFWVHSSNLFAAHLMIVQLQDMDLKCYYKPIIYNVEHMKYDEKGISLP